MPFDNEPEEGMSLFDVVLCIAVCLIVVPGVIWWLGENPDFISGLLR